MMIKASEYLQWGKQTLKITSHPNIGIINYQSNEDSPEERGIICQRDYIKENSTLFTLPYASILTVDTIGTSLSYLHDMNMREDDILAITLLHLKHDDINSKWSYHIKLLPTAYHSIPNFTDEELDMIIGSNLYMTAKQWKTQIRGDYDDLIRMRCEDVMIGEMYAWLTYDAYLWALCTIWSRFITITRKGQMRRGMVPIVDILNHDPLSKVSHIFNDSTDIFSIVSSEPHHQGKEVYLNYGHTSNARLLMLYGFTIIDNPYASVDIYASMNPSASCYAMKRQALDRVGVNDQQPFVVDSNGVPASLLTFIRIQNAQVVMKGYDSVEKLCTLSERYDNIADEERVCQTIVATLEVMIQGYATSIEDDEKIVYASESIIMKSGSVDEVAMDSTAGGATVKAIDFLLPRDRVMNAKVLVYSEKKILRDAIVKLREYMNTLS